MALEGEDVEVGVEFVDLECVAVVAEDGARFVGQSQTSLAYRSGWGRPSLAPLVQALDSFQEGQKG
ncbi:hypothetical protein D3C87_1723590 [compost metagenome]